LFPPFDHGAELYDLAVYDPATGTFSRAGLFGYFDAVPRATLLLNGGGLFTGGADIGGSVVLEALRLAPLPAPALFSLSGDGRGQGAIWHAQSGQIASADNPAVAGDALSMYATNLADGGVIPPQVSVGGRLARGCTLVALLVIPATR
jgi:hypothetical protein